MEETGASEAEIKRIIERLKEKESVVGAPLAKKVGDIKARIEGVAVSRPLNFNKVTFEKTSTPVSKFVGDFYSSFEKPITDVASFLSNMSFAKNIRRELVAADIDLTPEAYLITVATFAVVGSMMFLLLNIVIGVVLMDFSLAVISPVSAITIFVLVAFGGLVYPKMASRSRAVKCERELPYALRQLSTQVKAGMSFHRALISISESDYGLLSVEFKKTIKDLDAGVTLEEALTRMVYRIKSNGLKRVVTQIIRSIRVGGNLSDIISHIADEISFESRMKIRDFTEKLNMVNVVYIMVAVVAPVTLTIFASIMQLPMFQGTFPSYYVPVGFIGITFGMCAILYVTKMLEPMT